MPKKLSTKTHEESGSFSRELLCWKCLVNERPLTDIRWPNAAAPQPTAGAHTAVQFARLWDVRQISRVPRRFVRFGCDTGPFELIKPQALVKSTRSLNQKPA